ncbi:MAG: hypothetical protein ACXV5Q_00825 [Frankiaceae bacterium]
MTPYEAVKLERFGSLRDLQRELTRPVPPPAICRRGTGFVTVDTLLKEAQARLEYERAWDEYRAHRKAYERMKEAS